MTARSIEQEKVLGGIVGSLVGDALGVPYEFNPPERLPSTEAIDMNPPEWFHRSHPGTPPGTWSDDGALLLALVDSIVEYEGGGRANPDDLAALFGERLVAWYVSHDFTPDRRVFDVGGTTVAAINAIRRGTPARVSGLVGERTNGNGSLMRSIPVALARGTAREKVSRAMIHSAVTHRDPLSRVCCAVFTVWVHFLARKDGPTESDIHESFEQALDVVEEIVSAALESREETPGVDGTNDELDAIFRVRQAVVEFPPRGSGFVLDTLISARNILLRTSSYEDAVLQAVALGHDTDTTACVTGGVAGVIYGFDGIPSRWWLALNGLAMVHDLVGKFSEFIEEGGGPNC